MRYRFVFLAALCLTIAGFSVSQAANVSLAALKNITAAAGAVQISNAPALSSNFCINYDEEIIENSFSTSTVTADLTNIYGLGIKCVRIGSFWSSTSTQGTYTRMLHTADVAHTLGVETRCMIQGPNGGSLLTSTAGSLTNIGYWESVVVSETEQGKGSCDRTDIGNEQLAKHDGTLTDAQVISGLQAIATAVKSDGVYTGPISYAAINNPTPSGELGELEAVASGGTVAPLDQICVNIYTGSPYLYPVTELRGYLQNIYSYFPNGCVTEWNTSSNGQTYAGFSNAQNDLSMALAMQTFRDFNAPGQVYYFTYSNPLGMVNAVDAFAVNLHTGTFQSWWTDVFAGYANGTY